MNPEASVRNVLRSQLRARRAALTPTERIIASQALVESLEKIPEFLTDQRIGGYWAIAGELPLAALIQGLRARGQNYYLPVVGDDRRLEFAAWQPGGAIAMNRHGIPEPVCGASERIAPEQLDVVLLPLLGFDRSGHRLGFGGGYYDRSFEFLRERSAIGRPVLVGIGYAVQEIAAIDAMPWDVRLDYIATDQELIDCTPTAS
jgi:5-formyltetrahydrofolate cyclo-ligase